MKKKLLMSLCLALTIQPTFATKATSGLKEERKQVVQRYLADLEKADYRDIIQLFTSYGFVVSTSKGKVAAKDFFYDFLPNIATAHLEQHQTYHTNQPNVLGTRFYFSFEFKNGEQGAGEYVDEFIFAPDSAKLNAVYMFENKYFPKD